jgi:hypothetical protein
MLVYGELACPLCDIENSELSAEVVGVTISLVDRKGNPEGAITGGGREGDGSVMETEILSGRGEVRVVLPGMGRGPWSEPDRGRGEGWSREATLAKEREGDAMGADGSAGTCDSTGIEAGVDCSGAVGCST